MLINLKKQSHSLSSVHCVFIEVREDRVKLFQSTLSFFFMWSLDIAYISQPWGWHWGLHWCFSLSGICFFSFDSLRHFDKILKSPKIRCWRLEAGNRWRKWNESILHLYSFVEQGRFGINLNSNDAYHSWSILYLQNSLKTLVYLSITCVG